MKIVYVIEDFYVGGGVERIVSEKANYFSEEYGHCVTIISIYEDNHKERAYPLIDKVGLVCLNVPMAGKSNSIIFQTFNRIKTLFLATKRLNKTIKQLNPDIIFFATTMGALLLPLCKTKARRIFESHLAFKHTPYKSLFGLMIRKADNIICLTKEDAEDFKKAKDVRVIPNFIKIKELPQCDYNSKKAIAIGRLEYQKGFDIMIDCWKEIQNKFPDWQLHIYGEGSMKESLQKQIDEYKLNDHVILCGRNENIIEKYNEYSLFLTTSRYEGLPMVLIESQCYGLPAVSFNFKCGAKEILEDNFNGFLIPQGNKLLFCEKAKELMSSIELRKKLGTAALKTAEKFRKEDIMKLWNKLITS